ncbi:hypothetical protein [Streptomyces katsurahamanus]|uniref:Uncharacterized protein n=1 Tax=Streptomyces katsurahamanus TaxID=2577098 RepID=A0ABW9NT27_9ACTN|nr:hypothetical protein [Streptomyces katsurahamanus]MQS36462.1 hypothetical protein [Streptomyces katsurahamanus]
MPRARVFGPCREAVRAGLVRRRRQLPRGSGLRTAGRGLRRLRRGVVTGLALPGPGRPRRGPVLARRPGGGILSATGGRPVTGGHPAG